jgi:hypothetical protein
MNTPRGDVRLPRRHSYERSMNKKVRRRSKCTIWHRTAWKGLLSGQCATVTVAAVPVRGIPQAPARRLELLAFGTS